jgi:hypothetical protein
MGRNSTPLNPYRHGLASMFGALRHTKWPLYAIPFGLGLTIWFLLIRNTVSPPAPPIRASDNATHHTAGVARRTAVSPKTTVTTNGAQDLRALETPSGESNGRVRPAADILQDATVIVRAPHVSTDSAYSSKEPARRAASHRIQARPHETTSMSTRAQYDPATVGPTYLRRQPLPYPSITHRRVDRPANHGPN